MQSPTPANPDNVQRQLAIFDVVRRARGKTLAEVKSMLVKAFAERGLSRQPAVWVDAVASEAAYGKSYIVDLPSAVAADSITNAPDPRVEDILRGRRDLRLEGTESAGNQPPGDALGVMEEGRSDGRPRTLPGIPPLMLLGFAAAVATIAVAAQAGRTALRRSRDTRSRALRRA